MARSGTHLGREAAGGSEPEAAGAGAGGSEPEAAGPAAEVRVLGPVAVLGPGGTATLVGSRQRAVVGLLALKVGGVLPQWRLVDALWGDDPPRTAVKSLHSHVARVRQALAGCGLPDALVTRESGYLLAVAPDTVDAWRFERDAELGRDHLTGGEPARAAALLQRALRLWRADSALADAAPAGWGAAEVDRLAEVRLTATENLWDAELRLGGHARAVGEIERLLVHNPNRERLVGLLMLALYRCDRHTAALDAYQRLRARLADDMGLDTAPELHRLHTQMLRRDHALDLPAPPDRSPPVRPVGAVPPAGHRRSGDGATSGDLDPLPDKDPIAVREAPGGRSPALRAPRRGGPDPAGPMPTPAQLPARVGHFTNRVQELGALDALLAPDGDVRLAVISGPAGIGKTSLAVQWAHRVVPRFTDGQLFVELRGHEPGSTLAPSEALSQMLRSLGVPADRIPVDLAGQASLYRSLLHDRHILIIIDNGGSARDILPLVPAGAGNVMVVTARTAMAALATHHAVCHVNLDVLGAGDALDLLGKVLGPAAVHREPAAAAELVRLCDRMPLALRIAGAKLAGLPEHDDRAPIGRLVRELHGPNRLDALAVDEDARSVRTVFASAYRTLGPPQARLFRLLGLHPAPTFHVHLAAALAGESVEATRALLGTLVAAHLVLPAGPDRYRFHDLIALFAHRCAAVDEPVRARTEALARIVDWYLAVAHATNRAVDPGRDRVTPDLRHPPAELPFPAEPRAALSFLDSERGNLLPVVRFTAERGFPAATPQLSYLLTGFYESRGHWGERVEMCNWAITAAQQVGDAVTEGLMRSGLGVAYITAHRFEEALDPLYRALALMRAGGDNRGIGHVHNNIAAAYSGLRRFDEAVEAFRGALRVHSAAGHKLGIALARNNIGHTYVRMGRAEDGLTDLRAAVELSREIGNARIEAAALHSLGEAELARDQPGAALEHFGRAMLVYQRLGDRRYLAETLNGLGVAHLRRGEHGQAMRSLARALELGRDLADQHLEAITLHALGQVHLQAGRLDAAGEHLSLALALRARIPDAFQEAEVRRDLGEAAWRRGDPQAARVHWSIAVEVYRKANATREADRLAARLGPSAHDQPPPVSPR